MTTIQNVATIELSVNENDHRIPFLYDAIKNKKINNIYLFCGGIDFELTSPYSQSIIDPIGPIGIEDYFLNLIDVNGNPFVKDFSFNNNIVSGDKPDFEEINLDRVLDLNKSHLTYNIGTMTGSRKLLLVIIYQSENLSKLDDEVNGSITFEVPITSTNQDILLKDFIFNNLQGKKIKKIIPGYNLIKPNNYLDIVTKDGKHIQNLPSLLIGNQGTKEFYFDNIEIDFEKSYFRQRGNYTSIWDFDRPAIVNEKFTLTFIF